MVIGNFSVNCAECMWRAGHVDTKECSRDYNSVQYDMIT